MTSQNLSSQKSISAKHVQFIIHAAINSGMIISLHITTFFIKSFPNIAYNVTSDN